MNTKLKCLILDDEIHGLTYLKMLCEQIPELEVVKAFNNPLFFLNDIKSLDFDFCILDIDMPELSGIQVANIIKNKPIIFATAHKDYAVEAFDLSAIDYIIKPIKIDRLQQAIDKVKKNFITPNEIIEKKYIHWNSNKGKSILYFDKIAYIKTSENDSRDKIVILFDHEEIVLKNITFEKLEQSLPKLDFCRINKKEIIAIKAIKVFSFDEITTSIISEGRNLKLFLSDNYKQQFIQKIEI